MTQSAGAESLFRVGGDECMCICHDDAGQPIRPCRWMANVVPLRGMPTLVCEACRSADGGDALTEAIVDACAEGVH